MFRGAKKRTFRFGKKNVSFPKVETFRFADYKREELNFDQMKQKWIAYVNAYGSNVPGEINTVGKFAKRMGYKYDESKGTYYK